MNLAIITPIHVQHETLQILRPNNLKMRHHSFQINIHFLMYIRKSLKIELYVRTLKQNLNDFLWVITI